METPHTCPACRQSGALIALGSRRDRPHRWQPWRITITHLYLCDRCDAIVPVEQAPRPALAALKTPLGRAGRPLAAPA